MLKTNSKPGKRVRHGRRGPAKKYSPYKKFESIEDWLKDPTWNGESSEEEAKAAYWAIKERVLADKGKWSQDPLAESASKEFLEQEKLEKILKKREKELQCLKKHAEQTDNKLDQLIFQSKQEKEQTLKSYDDKNALECEVKEASLLFVPEQTHIQVQAEVGVEVEVEEVGPETNEDETKEEQEIPKRERTCIFWKDRTWLVAIDQNKEFLELIEPRNCQSKLRIHIFPFDRDSTLATKKFVAMILDHHTFAQNLLPIIGDRLSKDPHQIWTMIAS